MPVRIDNRDHTETISTSFSCIVGSRGFHQYKDSTWRSPSLSDKLSLLPQPHNPEDKHAVAVVKGDDQIVVGHLPREISRQCFWFLKLGGWTTVKLQSTTIYQSPIALRGLELLLEITFFIDHAKSNILGRLRDHIRVNYNRPNALKKCTKKRKKNSGSPVPLVLDVPSLGCDTGEKCDENDSPTEADSLRSNSPTEAVDLNFEFDLELELEDDVIELQE